MDWDKLKIFHTVAESGSFTKASTILNLSQSAISRQIQSLENELKIHLFERHARGLVLLIMENIYIKQLMKLYQN